MTDARAVFTELKGRAGAIPDAELDAFRGELTATMVYDRQPTHDHFKKIDDTAVMGIMNGKRVLATGRYFYFYLQRI